MRLVTFLFFLLGTCFFSACSYSLGTGGNLDFSTIQIAPIKNHTYLPHAQAPLARSISDCLNREPKLKTVLEGAEAELLVEIVKYTKTASANLSQDSLVASSVILQMDLECSLLNKRNGKYYFKKRRITVQTESYPGSATGLSETQVFPVLSRDAAREVRNLVVGVW